MKRRLFLLTLLLGSTAAQAWPPLPPPPNTAHVRRFARFEQLNVYGEVLDTVARLYEGHGSNQQGAEIRWEIEMQTHLDFANSQPNQYWRLATVTGPYAYPQLGPTQYPPYYYHYPGAPSYSLANTGEVWWTYESE